MLLAALRDMQWRRRRFVIAILSTSIIFAMTLALTGLANGFRVEAEKTVDSLGVDVFLVKAGASGPFVGATPFAPVDLSRIASAPGVDAAVPLAYAGGTATLGDTTRNVDIFGAPERGPGMPVVSEGQPPSTPDEVAVSSTLGRQIGDDVEIASRRLRIVGIVENSTALANLPNVFLTTQGAQQLVYGGQPLVSSIGIRGTLGQTPDGYRAIDRAGAIADLLRPLKVAVSSITIVVDSQAMLDDLSNVRAEVKSRLTSLAEQPNELLAGLPLIPFTPRWLVRQTEGIAMSTGQLPVGCSNLGNFDPVIGRIDGGNASEVSMRLAEQGVTRERIERARGQLFCGTGTVNGSRFITVVAYRCGAENTAAPTRELAGGALADLQLSATTVR